MRKSLLLIAALSPLALAALLAACNKNPSRPAGLLAPSAPVVTRLAISGPADVAPGQTAQFTATAHLSNGSTQNVTGDARWQSSNGAVLDISGGGQATAHEIGEVTITAEFSFVRSTREVIIVPAGTYRVIGVVSEAGTIRVPLAEARIEVTGGTGAGMSTTTAGDGRYRLYGVAGQTELRITKAGYQPLVQSIVVADHRSENFGLALENPRANVAGIYTLTITASPACSDDLPEEARERQYIANVIQDGPHVEARLSGSTFVVLRSGRGNHFRGLLENDKVAFQLAEYTSYYKGYGQSYGDLVEYIAAALRYLVIDGSAELRVSGSNLSGTLSGNLQVFRDDPRWSPTRLAQCKADDHRFSLTR